MKSNIDTFLDYITVERGFSGNTLMAYRNDLYSLLDHIQPFASSWDYVTNEILNGFGSNLEERGYSTREMETKLQRSLAFPFFLLTDKVSNYVFRLSAYGIIFLFHQIALRYYYHPKRYNYLLKHIDTFYPLSISAITFALFPSP